MCFKARAHDVTLPAMPVACNWEIAPRVHLCNAHAMLPVALQKFYFCVVASDKFYSVNMSAMLLAMA